MRTPISRAPNSYKEGIVTNYYARAIVPETFQKTRQERLPEIAQVGTMCGEYCAIKLLKQYARAEH